MFTDEFLSNGALVAVIKEEVSNGVAFSCVRLKRSRVIGWLKTEYLVLDPIEPEEAEDKGSDDDDDDYFSLHGDSDEDEGVHLLSCGVCAVLFLIVCVLCSQVQRTRMYSTSRRSPRTARARGAGGSSV